MIDLQLCVQTLLLFVSSIGGAVVSISMALTLGDFKNECILYGHWVNHSGWMETFYGSRSLCSYIRTIHGFSLSYSFVLGCYSVYAIHQSRHNEDFVYKMWVMPRLFFAAIITILVLIASGIITAGFASWCHSFIETGPYTKCSVVDEMKWLKTPIPKKSVYRQLQVSEVASWVCFFLWVLQTGFCILRILRNRRRYSRETDPNSDRANIGEINPSA